MVFSALSAFFAVKGDDGRTLFSLNAGVERHLPLAKGGSLDSKRGVQDWLTIIVLGLIEGITEFLPVSSTGHLLLAEHWLPRQSDLFNVVIQCGAVVAVIPLFPERWRQVFFRWHEPATRDFVLKASVAFALTGAGGLLLDKLGFELPKTVTPVSAALIVGGILFVVVERWLRGRTLREEITWTVALAVGLGQLVAAVFPGTSRSGATILLLLALGLSRPAATEFSFLIGIPTMLAAGGLKVFKALHHGAPSEPWGMVCLGTVVSAVVSFVVVRWLLRFVQTHTFTGLGWYRIAAGLAMLALALW
jgi:undecaprenyl-diphosphatase